MSEAQWNVLFVMQGKEFVVHDKIERLLLKNSQIKEVLLPVSTSEEIDQKQKRHQKISPIYPGYLFLNIEPSSSVYSTILGLENVIKFLGEAIDKPSKLRDNEIKIVKSMTASGKKSNLDKYKLGQMVEILNGHCKKLPGKIIQMNKTEDTVKVEIKMFNRSITTTIKSEDIQPA